MAQDKRCVVFYKKGWISGPRCYGNQFDKLEECCATFRNIFSNTGNEKSNVWGKGNLYDSKPGLNFVVRGGGLTLLLYGAFVKFCPWCGSIVEIKQSKNVILKEMTREVPGGFEEVEMSTDV